MEATLSVVHTRKRHNVGSVTLVVLWTLVLMETLRKKKKK